MALIALVVLLCLGATAHAEVLVRWDQDRIPSRQSLGIDAVVVPVENPRAVRHALTHGYRVFVEVPAPRLASVAVPATGIAGVIVRGTVSAAQLAELKARVKSRAVRVLTIDERGKWPHIRANWVTRNNDVLQVSGRTAQPWIENNAALARIIAQEDPGRDEDAAFITYAWKPITVSQEDEGPALADYLVAIDEAGSFGVNLVLPLHRRFQRNLLRGTPQARTDWAAIRRHLEFYSWDLASRYEHVANVGVVTANPTLWFEVMNLLLRHNLPFELIAPAELPKRKLEAFQLVIVLDEPDRAGREVLTAFERAGGLAKIVNAPVDPNGFALEMRQLLGRERRIIDIWNGITVLTSLYAEPGGTGALLTVLNYAQQPLPVQLRIAGTYAQAQYESPEDAATYVPVRHRNGFTEFVLPSVRIGGRVFLTR